MANTRWHAGAKPLFTGPDWTYDDISRVYQAIEPIALGELGLKINPNQIEVIDTEQMLDAYASMGMPLFYKHWSFGKHYARDEMLYRKGQTGLAYEIVINSRPCISYIMEGNTLCMQTLVIAHAAFGHNHFFRNNRLFREGTDAEGILDYLDFAKGYVEACEQRHGTAAVERVLDAAHALMDQGVHRHPRPHTRNLREERERELERRRFAERTFNDLWRTVPESPTSPLGAAATASADRRARLGLPEENLLYFIEKRSPVLQHWERELVRIVRNVAQYFHPQRQTKVMNEGCATAVHYAIMTRLHERGQLTDGSYLEFLHNHSNVIFQPGFDDPRYSGMNPYALGFAILQDIQRMALHPTEEDRRWFPDIAGSGDWLRVWHHAWSEFRDESFILQFLSPRVIRDLRLFRVQDDPHDRHLVVDAIHDERGYRELRRSLAAHYDLSQREPDIQIVDVDLDGDRRLTLEHRVRDGLRLDRDEGLRVLRHLANLWGHGVKLCEVDADTGRLCSEYPEVGPDDGTSAPSAS